MDFYHVVSSSDNVPYATDGWEEHVRKKGLVCRGCSQTMPGIRIVDAQLRFLPDKTPIQGVPKVGVGLIRQAFIDSLGRAFVEEHLNLGTVTDESGRVIPELATFSGKYRTELRGDERSPFHVCKECGRPMYYPMGKRYIIRNGFSFKPLSESNISQLVIDQETLERIDLKRWKKIYIEEVPIVDTPADGLAMRLEDQKVDRAPEF